MKPPEDEGIGIRPTADGAGLELELPHSPSTERLEWLANELHKVIAYLDQLPQKRPPKKGAKGSPVYAAGLHDMAQWILEKVQSDIDWQAARQFLGDAIPGLPEDSSSFEFKPTKNRKQAQR